jgi:hypothetical protein
MEGVMVRSGFGAGRSVRIAALASWALCGPALYGLAGCGPAAPPPPPPSAAEVHAAAVREFQKTDGQFALARRGCEAGTAAFDAIVHTADLQSLYEAATKSAELCAGSWSDVGSVSFGDPIPQAAQTALNAAVHTCSDAYAAQGAAFKDIADTANGENQRPSQISEGRHAIASGKQAMANCAAQYAAAVQASGLAPADSAASGRAASGHRRRRVHAG